MLSKKLYRQASPVVLLYLLSFFGSFVLAQDPSQHDDIVVVIDGVDYTAADIDRLRSSLPAQYKQSTSGMNNGAFLTVYSELLGFAKRAEEAGVPDEEPFRTQLQFNRLNYLAQVYLQKLNENIRTTKDDYQAYYDAHRMEFEERAVSAIYIDYSQDLEKSSTSTGQHSLSENKARIKAKDIVKQLKNGADFAQLAKEHSTDTTSARKGGALGLFKYNAKIPPLLRDIIFSLKSGTFSAAHQHSGRFYIFRVTDVKTPPLDQVKKNLASKVRALQLRQKIDAIRATVTIETRNENYMTKTPPKSSVKLGSGKPTTIELPVPPRPAR